MKPVEFLGDSIKRVRNFPDQVKYDLGRELFLVQNGQNPHDWKPMSSIGSGVKEIRIRDDNGAFRVVYTAQFAEFIYVLHAFQKKTEQTELSDIHLAKARFKQLILDRTSK
jgi:phage-related protein